MALGFLALIAAGAAAVWVMSANEQHIAAVNHTHTVQQQVGTLQLLVERSETARRGYIIDSSPRFRATFDRIRGMMRPQLDRISQLTADNPRQVARVAQLRRLTAHLMGLSVESNALVDAHRLGTATRTFHEDDSVETVAQMRTITAAMATEEQRLLRERNARQQGSVQTFYAVVGGTGLLLVIVALVAVVTVMRYTRALTSARDQLHEANDTLEDAVEERTADLVRANEEIQRFAYIVSHDLRSPLVNVMGFTAELEAATETMRTLIDRAEETAPEIVTEEARLAAREDLPEAIGFIRTSTRKMDALINAILKLSREGRRVLAPEPVDMDRLVDNIKGAITHRLDERGAEMIVHHPLPGLVSDRLAIDQILSNLVDNAVKYLRPDVPGRIEVSGRREGRRVFVEVKDNGRGIDPRDHARVFDLFRRSGVQDQPGEGIGLAHVRALVYRLGGVIDVASAVGEGATFRLTLPEIMIQPQDDHK